MLVVNTNAELGALFFFSCSLPIFVKLVFAEICRWKSYSRAQETHLASNVMDSIMMLFERIEIQVGL